MSGELLEAARRAAEHAYAPYSQYPVGAAVRDEDGRIWAGCNVENESFGLTVCAERNAVFGMVAGGGKQIEEILVLTSDAATPCGACLQVLSEFATPALPIHLTDGRGSTQTLTLKDLLPLAFNSQALRSNAT